MTVSAPEVVFWDCDGVLANNSEALAMPIAGIILNEAMQALHPDAPQFDIPNFTTKYAGGHFSQFHALAAEMLREFDATLSLPAEADLDILKVARTVEVLTAQAMPAADLSNALQKLDTAGLRQCVVSSSELNRVLPCVEKIVDSDRIFGGAWAPGNTGGKVFSAADTMQQVFGRRIVKPAPDVAWFAATAMGLNDLKKGIAVEDSLSGAACWVSAGIPVVGYTGGDHILDKKGHAEKLMEKGCVAVFETMTDVARYITSLRQPEAVPNAGAKFGAAVRPA